MIKAAQALERVGAAKPATANISPALAIRAINIPAPARATPAAPAPPAAENILNVIAQTTTLGMGVTVFFLAHQATNTLALVQAIPEALALPAAANIPLVPAPLATNGKMAAVRNKCSTAPKVSCIIAMAKLLVYVLRVWASNERFRRYELVYG